MTSSNARFRAAPGRTPGCTTPRGAGSVPAFGSAGVFRRGPEAPVAIAVPRRAALALAADGFAPGPGNAEEPVGCAGCAGVKRTAATAVLEVLAGARRSQLWATAFDCT